MSFGRIYTNTKGDKISATFVKADDKIVTFKLTKNAKFYTFEQSTFSQKGKKVGNGECWTLAEEAFKFAGLKRQDRPGVREWGRVVDWKNEEVQPGDILELKDVRFSKSMTGANHTAVIMFKGRGGNFMF